MLPHEYPAQEPFTAIGEKYHVEVLQRGQGIGGVELSYGGDPYQSLVVVPAPTPNGDVLLTLHGGGWTSGYKEWMLFMAPTLTARGVTFASAGYRLAPSHVFPAQLEDVADAIALLHTRVADWGGDRSRMFVTGHSAGAHLAALIALRQDWQRLRGLPSDIVRGALPISGTYYFDEQSGLSMRPRFLGPAGNGLDDAASPMSHIGAEAPPFLIAYGDRDFPHLRRQAVEFEQALRAVGADASSIVIADSDHLGASYASGDGDGLWVDHAVSWMRAH